MALRVGLTGGIGSGKSTVARRLAEHGALVIDADEIAREVVAPGTPGHEAVVAEFGEQVLRPDGLLDRPALGRLVFAAEDRRLALNAIVHPLVGERREELLAAAPDDVVVVEDIPLLVENGLAPGFHLVVVVGADAAERVRRLMDGRGMNEDDAWSRVRAQAGDEQRRAAADVWLDNSGDVTTLEAAADELWDGRLAPFEANLRERRRAPRPTRATLVPPDGTWPEQANRVIARIEHVAGSEAHSLEHIGSTSVPGLDAKDVIDIQVGVHDLDVAWELAERLADVGLVAMPGRWWDVGRDGREHDKAMACNADPGRAVNVHIRPVESPTWRDAILLRDWLRATPDAVRVYAELKHRLAAQPHDSIDDYAQAKTPWINDALARAELWVADSGWEAPERRSRSTYDT